MAMITDQISRSENKYTVDGAYRVVVEAINPKALLRGWKDACQPCRRVISDIWVFVVMLAFSYWEFFSFSGKFQV